MPITENIKEKNVKFFVPYKKGFGTAEEYEDYCELVNRVALIDKDTAIELSDPNNDKFPHFNYSGNLSDCFCWSTSTKGYVFWENINDALKKLELDELKKVDFSSAPRIGISADTSNFNLPEELRDAVAIERMEYIYNSNFFKEYFKDGWKILSIFHGNNQVVLYKTF